jgi:hypothetical protein
LPAGAAPADSVFKVGNFPVEARASDAVAAKERALADGQKAALRSLIKRLVPVTSYNRLRKLDLSQASRMVDGVQVRSERNSSTEYFASLDFSFDPVAVRALLQREGFPIVETQAQRIDLVPLWSVPSDTSALPPAFNVQRGAQSWVDAWKSLDLQYTLTPARLELSKVKADAETIRTLLAGDTSKLRAAFVSGPVIAAVAVPDPATNRLQVTLVGSDAVGPIYWQRAYRVDRSDPGYAIDLAAVVALGVLEGRWKAGQDRASGFKDQATAMPAASRAPSATGQAVDGDRFEVAVDFRGMSEWTDISRRLSATDGVTDMDVAGLSGRGARVTLRFPGGPQRLSDLVMQQGLLLRNQGGTWRLSLE